MPIFSYKVKDSRGRDLEGAVEAADSSQATDVLKERGYQVVSLTQREETSIGNISFTFLQRIKPEDIVVFSRQLSVMVGASISIVRSLRTAARQTATPKLRGIILDIAGEVEGGVRLSDAFAKYPHVFGTFYVNMLRSGETSG